MKTFEIAGVPRDEVHRFVRGLHSDPFSVLGPHKVGDDVEIRVFCPHARAIEIVLDREPDKPMAAERIDEEGFFCATVPGAERDIPYQLRIVKLDGSEELMRDAYQYGPIMGDVDLHLFSEGQHWKIYEKFGAHLRTIGDATGVYFAVWAPNAQRVSVVGDFNDWDGRVNPMRKLLNAGVWELFLPEIKQGAHYKFEIRTQTDAVLLKSDPFAFFNQHGKSTASLVYDLERYTWSDADWMEARQQRTGRKLRSAFTRCTSAHGVAKKEIGSLLISNWRTRCCRTCWRWDTRTSKCCPLPNIRSKARGVIKLQIITRLPAGSDRPMICVI